MCPFTQVHYKCGHRVYTVRAWCDRYERTHVRCKVFVVAWEIRYVCVFVRSQFSLRRPSFHFVVLCLPVTLPLYLSPPSQASFPSPSSSQFSLLHPILLHLHLSFSLALAPSIYLSLCLPKQQNTNILSATTPAVPADLPSKHPGWKPSSSPSSPNAVSAGYGASSRHHVSTGRARHP